MLVALQLLEQLPRSTFRPQAHVGGLALGGFFIDGKFRRLALADLDRPGNCAGADAGLLGEDFDGLSGSRKVWPIGDTFA